jgi:hypothetical protein
VPFSIFDLATIQILNTATIDKLRELYSPGRFEPRRFQPDLIVSPYQCNGFVENEWVDQILNVLEPWVMHLVCFSVVGSAF